MSTTPYHQTPPQALLSIQTISPYVPGKPIESLQRELGLTDIIKLASNENPFGMSPKAREAAQQALSEASRYPDGHGFQLKKAIAKRFVAYAIRPNQIVLGNGSNDIIDLVARAFLAPGDAAVFSQYAFAVYGLVAQSVNAKRIEVPTQNFTQDLAAMVSSIRKHQAKVVFLANPNNPTGVWSSMDQVKKWIEDIPSDCVILLDEAYCEFLDTHDAYSTTPDENLSMTWLADHPNLIITRTFSKIYGLAGLRVGYAIAHPQVADWINRLRQPFNVGHMALAAATAAFDDSLFVQKTRKNNTDQRQHLEIALHKMGATTLPSRGNFIAFQMPKSTLSGMDIFNALLEKGVIVRPLESYGLPQWIRVTVGLPQENQRFLQALSVL